MKTTWVCEVKVMDRSPMWVGHFHANGRADAKREALRFVAQHLPLDKTRILRIAKGMIEVQFHGEPELFDA